MPLPGYVGYRRREYCRDVCCPLQAELEACKEGSDAYATVRDRCKTSCIHTAYEFHHWLIERGYLLVRPGPGTGERQGG